MAGNPPKKCAPGPAANPRLYAEATALAHGLVEFGGGGRYHPLLWALTCRTERRGRGKAQKGEEHHPPPPTGPVQLQGVRRGVAGDSVREC